MNKIVEPARDIPILSNVDVLIVGGGCAGSAAAIVAARAGAKTLVIEPQAFLGGIATQALFATWAWDRGLGPIPYGGIPHELVDRLMNEKSAVLPRIRTRGPNFEPKGFYDFTYNLEILKLVLGEFMEEVGAEVLYHTTGVLPIIEDGAVKGRAGAPFEDYPPEVIAAPVEMEPFASVHQGRHMVTPFDIHVWVLNVDWDRVDQSEVRKCWEKSYDPKRLVQLHAGWQGGTGELWKDRIATFWLIVRGKRGADAMDLNFGEKALKQSALEFWRLLRDCSGFEKAHIVKLSHKAEVRGTRRIYGDYILTKMDVIQGSKFPDSIVSTPRRAHHGRGGGDTRVVGVPNVATEPAKGMHGIPYRCLLPKGVEGLLTAGRCISTEFETMLGHPNIPTCMLIGQAAGAAAALAADKGVLPRKVDIGVVQKRLTDLGAEVNAGIGDSNTR
jgi:hypothetical protein